MRINLNKADIVEQSTNRSYSKCYEERATKYSPFAIGYYKKKKYLNILFICIQNGYSVQRCIALRGEQSSKRMSERNETKHNDRTY